MAGIGDKVLIAVVEQRRAQGDAFGNFPFQPHSEIIAGFRLQIGIADRGILLAAGVAGAEVQNPYNGWRWGTARAGTAGRSSGTG